MAAARLRLIAAVAIMAAWEALAASGLLFRDVVPSLWYIAKALAITLADPAFYRNLGVTSGEFLMAVSVGGLAGASAGLALGANRFLAAAYERWVHYLAPVPKIIFFPALLLAFGAGPGSKIAMGAISCFFPVAISVASGVRAVRPVLLNVGHGFRATTWQMATKIYLPAVREPLLNGLRLGFGVAAIGILLAETKLSKAGIGFLVMDSYRRFDMPGMYALLILVVLLVAAVNAALTRLNRN
ncbi:MAG: ABC transporter permease subunit [Acetobacteraceae bacterium]|nr:ABC transporter permease subunit [Acetobacteraceae bacterium]